MKTLLIVFYFSIIQIAFSFAQSFSSQNPEYIENVQLGEQALLSGEYESCNEYYEKAFQIRQTSVLSTLRAAACAHGSNDEERLQNLLDKAFELNYGEAKLFFNEYPEFEPFLGTILQKQIENRWNLKAAEDGLNLKLIKKLDEVRETDQAQRRLMREFSEKYGWQSPQMDSLWGLQSQSDSINTAYISRLIDGMGYPGKSVVGSGHASTAFLVIQHADIDVQVKYIDIIKKAADEGEVRWSSVALLVDRVNLRQGKPQIYGSQIGRDPETGENYVMELENPYKVDSLRTTVGLGSIQQYVNNWSLTWNPEKHVERIARIKASEDRN